MIKQTPIGERRHPIQILEPVAALGAWNNPEPSWKVLAWMRAAKKSHTGREFYQAQQRRNDITEIFNVAYTAQSAGITQKMRLVCSGQIYEIIDVDDLEGVHIEIDIVCKGLIS